MKYKKIQSKRGERIGAVPTRGAPKQKTSNGRKAQKTSNGVKDKKTSNGGKAKKGK